MFCLVQHFCVTAHANSITLISFSSFASVWFLGPNNKSVDKSLTEYRSNLINLLGENWLNEAL